MADRGRLEHVRKYIEQNQQVEVVEISKSFNVSLATARRDLDHLAEMGEIERTHGGARLVKNAPPEAPVLQRCNDQAEEKIRIAQATVALIHPGETILMAGGSTTYEVARQIKDIPELTVITNSFLVTQALVSNQGINLVTLGGFMRKSELLCYGHITEEALMEIYADKVIFGVRAVSIDRGLTIDYLPELSTDRTILTRGKEIIVVVDYTKFNRESNSLVGPISIMHKIITDNKAPIMALDAIRAMGIEVIVV